MNTRNLFQALALACLVNVTSDAQPQGANYDEAKAGNLPLPDPLRMEDGQKVADAKSWRNQRRPELLRLFETHVYGRSPGKPADLIFEKTSEDKNALGGVATRREISIYLNKERRGPRLDLLLYIPNAATQPAPAFLGLNFQGNHTIHADPGITAKKTIRNATNSVSIARGDQSSRWPVEKIMGRGYAVATMYYGDIDPMTNQTAGMIMNFLNYLVFPLTFVILAINQAKKANGGFLSFGQALKSGVLTGVIAASLLIAVFTGTLSAPAVGLCASTNGSRQF